MDTMHKSSSHKALRSSLKQVFEDTDYRISENDVHFNNGQKKFCDRYLKITIENRHANPINRLASAFHNFENIHGNATSKCKGSIKPRFGKQSRTQATAAGHWKVAVTRGLREVAQGRPAFGTKHMVKEGLSDRFLMKPRKQPKTSKRPHLLQKNSLVPQQNVGKW